MRLFEAFEVMNSLPQSRSREIPDGVREQSLPWRCRVCFCSSKPVKKVEAIPVTGEEEIADRAACSGSQRQPRSQGDQGSRR